MLYPIYRLGGLQVLLNEIDKYHIEPAAIQRIRWTLNGILGKK